jgi:serine/threonine protein kinase
MLSRHLPFDSNDDKEIGRKTIYQQIQFTHSIWDNVSAEAKDIIFKLLIKNKEERLTIKDTLDHPWFLKNNTEIQEMRKSANSGDDDVMKFITYSNADVNLAKESAKKSHGDSSPKSNIQVGALLEKGIGGLQHGPGSGNLPSLHMQL